MPSPVVSPGALLAGYASTLPSLGQACWSDRVRAGGLRLRLPGSLAIRASVLAGNVRMRAIIDAVVRPGATVVDVGANIGVITAYLAKRVGDSGRVFAFEPAADNVAVLRENLALNGITRVQVFGTAAGRQRETRELFVRGDVSAVNSLYPESCYASVTDVQRIEVVPLDEVVSGQADFVKIDVEGAELDVLAGMTRLLAAPALRLTIEWHPTLQRAGGFAPDELPRFLMGAGFTLQAVDHVRARTLRDHEIPDLTSTLLRAQRPVELFCARPDPPF